MRRARRASSSVGSRVQRLFPQKEGSSLLASSGTRVTRHSTPSYPASFISLIASSGVRSGRPTVKTPSFIDLLSIVGSIKLTRRGPSTLADGEAAHTSLIIVLSTVFWQYNLCVRKSFKYRLYPNCSQIEALDVMLESHRRLYNLALRERRDVYEAQGRSVSYGEQSRRFKETRK